MLRDLLLSSTLRGPALLLTAAVALAAGCRSTEVGTAQDALTAVTDAQTTCEDLGATVHQCLDALDTCVQGTADDAAVGACKATFAGCLPADAPLADGPDGEHHGGHHGHPGHPGPGGGHHGDMAGGCPGMGDGSSDGACDPGAPVVNACAVSLETCLATPGDAAACVSDAKTCVQSSIRGQFAQLCDAHAAACTAGAEDAAVCNDIASVCKAGVALPAIAVRARR
jgi:hypothetical protein